MTLFKRLTDLLRADAHGALDALEDRPLRLRQCLRDAEEALAAQRARGAALEAEDRELACLGERLEPRRGALDRDVTLALAGERQDLARFAAARLLRVRRRLESLAARRRDLAQEQSELAEVTARQEARLDDLRLRVRAAIERDPLGQGRCEGDPRPVADEDVELELLRRRRPDLWAGEAADDGNAAGESGAGENGGDAP